MNTQFSKNIGWNNDKYKYILVYVEKDVRINDENKRLYQQSQYLKYTNIRRYADCFDLLVDVEYYKQEFEEVIIGYKSKPKPLPKVGDIVMHKQTNQLHTIEEIKCLCPDFGEPLFYVLTNRGNSPSLDSFYEDYVHVK